MVGMRVRVNQIVDPQPLARREAQVTVGLADLRVYDRGSAGVGTADQVGAAAASDDGLEKHPPLLLAQSAGTPWGEGSTGAGRGQARLCVAITTCCC